MIFIGFSIILSVVIYTDYLCYIRGNDSIFFKDTTQLEKDLREIQELEAKQKIEKLKSEK